MYIVIMFYYLAYYYDRNLAIMCHLDSLIHLDSFWFKTRKLYNRVSKTVILVKRLYNFRSAPRWPKGRWKGKTA